MYHQNWNLKETETNTMWYKSSLTLTFYNKKMGFSIHCWSVIDSLIVAKSLFGSWDACYWLLLL